MTWFYNLLTTISESEIDYRTVFAVAIVVVGLLSWTFLTIIRAMPY